jgi:VCBS repeat-containing protein
MSSSFSLFHRAAARLSAFVVLGALLTVAGDATAATAPVARDDFYSATSGEPLQVDARHTFDLEWGTEGNATGEFSLPTGIGVSATGVVYVADRDNGRIQVFKGDGQYISQWGSSGIGDGQFGLASGLAVGPDGSVYVVDTSNQRVQKFAGDGTYLTQWGSQGVGSGKFDQPFGIATDSLGNVYVTDYRNYRVQKFTSDGLYLTQWGSQGSEDGEFNFPFGIAVDGDDYVYVADWSDSRIQKFTSDGTFITKWGSIGNGPGQLDVPLGMGIDPSGSIYVADSLGARIEKFASDGTYLAQWGSRGAGDGQFDDPFGVASDAKGQIYVADFANNRVERFSPAGVLGNDSDADDDALAAMLVSGPQHGTLNLSLDGSFTYTPEDGFRGTDTFTYTATDGETTSNVATAAITVARPLDTFVDDDESIFEDDIEWLAEEGITRGCNPPANDEFCPMDPVTRGQMAAFLVRAMGYTDDGGGDLFVDDDGSIFETDIDELATAGVTFGCNPPANDEFCPADPVTRGQMAAFLVRAMGYTDDGGGDLSVDDDGSIFETDIDKLATAGVTFGCNPPANDQFCPADPVTRGQMAAFLHRALG